MAVRIKTVLGTTGSLQETEVLLITDKTANEALLNILPVGKCKYPGIQEKRKTQVGIIRQTSDV